MSPTTSNYVKLAPATISLLNEKAVLGYFLTPRSSVGFSDFINTLAQVPFQNNPEAITIREPLGKPTLISLTTPALESFTQIAQEYLLPPSDDPTSLVLNNIPTQFLTPSYWPTAFPTSIMEHLPQLSLKRPNPATNIYQRYFMSSKSAFDLATMAGLIKPTPAKLSIFVNDVLANPNRNFIDNRPPHLIAQSQQNLLLGLPPVWFEPRPIDYRLHLRLTPETQTTLIQHAQNLNIQSRSTKHSTTATISAFLEAIGQDYLRWS